MFEVIKQDAVELCSTLGLMLKQKKENQDPAYIHMPFSLFPTPFPAELFSEAVTLQPILGEIVAGLIRDPTNNIAFVLKEMELLDEFLHKLLEISKEFNERRKNGLLV